MRIFYTRIRVIGKTDPIQYDKKSILTLKIYRAEMETGRVDRHRSGRPAGRVAGWVEILRPAGQAG